MRTPLPELIAADWAEALTPVADRIAAMGDFLRAELAAGRSYLPSGANVLRAFSRPLAGVRVLVVGQDPYPTPGHPVGLSFSVAPDVRPLPPSLVNIYAELEADLGIPRAQSGDLTPWFNQGVLLLNRVLTVRPGAPASHRGKGWEQVTECAIDALAHRGGPLVATGGWNDPGRGGVDPGMFGFTTPEMITPGRALPGRDQPILDPGFHEVLGTRIDAVPAGAEVAYFALGCFWGAEKLFWQLPGVVTTAVGYAGGYTPNPTYEEVCSGRTGHAETVKVVFDPSRTSYQELLRVFWENHDPTQGMRQGNDHGTQYRSAIYTTSPEQETAATASLDDFAHRLGDAGYGSITTQLAPAGPFFYAEDYHQQYLQKNPNGYCPIHATGVTCSPAA